MAAIQRASYALSFNLLNREGHSVLGIFNDKAGQTSTLEIMNTSRRNLRLKNLEATAASADKHHFELKFRPGTLSPTAVAQITIDEGAAGWKFSKATNPDGCLSFYLLSTKPGVLEAGNITSIKFDKLNADTAGGARGTKVELKWKDRNLQYVADGSGNPEDLVAGHRVKHLEIVNLRGEQYIPLHVGFVGTNQVLNDGTTNRLKLRLTNTLKAGQGDIILTPAEYPNPATDLIFSFENSDKEWTLGSVASIKMHYQDKGKEVDLTPDPQAKPPIWTLSPHSKITLAPGGFIDITIEDIVTTQQAGPTNLYLHYRNIPGYWDGDFVSVIEKAPLVYASNGVGIGTNDPKQKLHVAGKMHVNNDLSVGEKVTVDKLRVEKDVSVGGGGVFTVDAPGDAGGRLKIDTESKVTVKKLRVAKDVSVGGEGVFEIDAPNVVGGRIKISTDGKVGIGTGTNNPEAHLHVAGAGNQEIMLQSSDQNGGKWSLQSASGASSGRFDIFNRTSNESRLTILKDGKVGIGKTDPQAALHVNGDVRVKEDGVLFFEDTGEIRCADAAHRIMFRRKQNLLELREYGDIIFSPGSQPPNEGKETATVIMWADGTLGMGYLWKPAGDRNRATMRAKLDINGGVVTNVEKGYWFMNYGGVGGDHTFQTRSYGIWATHRIACDEFNAVSDARIKNIRGRSDGAADLATLLGIEVTDYSHKDVITKGSGAYKKLIGQQVEKVFPQAVTKCTEFVPDIYQRASIESGWILLATDLKQGDRVKLITESGQEDIHEVLEVTDEKFRVDREPEGERVFVYGREVDDFLTVDYDAIAMLNVSATQQIKKDMDQELTALRVENAELRAANDSLAKRLQLLESKLEALVGV